MTEPDTTHIQQQLADTHLGKGAASPSSSTPASPAPTPVAASVPRSSRPILRVLTLGDGNFSFSAALATMQRADKRAAKKKSKMRVVGRSEDDAAPSSSPASLPWAPSHRLQLIATSFDSGVSLHAKYPEAQKLIEKVVGTSDRSLSRVEHDVDATNLHATLWLKLQDAQKQQQQQEEGNKEKEEGQTQKSTAEGDKTATSSSASPSSPSASSVSASASASVPLPSAHSILHPAPVDPELQFDVIIFNHPHCGVEDLRRHSSLLAHFFHSAQEFLKKEPIRSVGADGKEVLQSPQIHVTLCQRQPEEWQLLQHASDKGFQLLSRSEFLETHFAGYQTKRHHVNKTFAKRSIQRMELFIFQRRLEGEIEGSGVDPTHPVYTRSDQDPTFQHNLMAHVIPLPAFNPTLPYEEAIKALQAVGNAMLPPPPVAAADHVSSSASASSKSAAPSLHTTYTCDLCHKGFSSERGLFYHKQDMHSSQSSGPTSGVNSRKGSVSTSQASRGEEGSGTLTDEHVCHQCEPARPFKNAVDLQQHILARHANKVKKGGETESTAASSPSSASLPSATSSSSSPSLPYPCPICPLSFPSDSALNGHLMGVQPISAASLECEVCGRIFSNERGLKQHVQAMSVTPEKHVRIVAEVGGAEEAEAASAAASGVLGEKALLGGAVQGRSKMKKLRGMLLAQEGGNAAIPQSVVQRLGIKKVEVADKQETQQPASDSS